MTLLVHCCACDKEASIVGSYRNEPERFTALIVACHGKRERVRILDVDVAAAPADMRIEAFRRPRT
jgi:hypothetical protein